jgi:uncharacterized protein
MTADVTPHARRAEASAPPPADADHDRPRFDVLVQHDLRVPTAEPGVTLSADIYRPVCLTPVPALVTVMPYRKDYVAGATYEAPARWFAARGYASAVVDMRGTGASDGSRRPEFDPGDGDDALATIDWAANQPWCDGTVGMWGMSYAANTTLRAASRRPPALRAIIAVAHALDAGRHSVHPDGARGDLHALVNRGTSLLLQQLLPPLVDHATPAAQRRWTQRLYETEPILLDYARHGPDDPLWTKRAIDGAAIAVPALCVGGWRDAFADGLIEAYERIPAPKRLIVGPWGHLLPQDSAFGPIDFLALALRWWDCWLRGADDRVTPEPAVLLSLGDARWRGYDAWPPGRPTLQLSASGDTLVPRHVPRSGEPSKAVGLYSPEPAVGMLRGLPGLGLGEVCPPQDQHDDDLRCVLATSAPLANDLLVGGRPEVTLRVDTVVPRLVVRLCSVDQRGRSTVISSGVLRPAMSDGEHLVVLRPVHHRVAAGDRIRVAVSDADFPRLTPLPQPVAFGIAGLRLAVPVVATETGTEVRPAAPTSTTLARPSTTTWTIARDLVHDAAEVTVTTDTADRVSREGHRYRVRGDMRAAVRRGAPEGSWCAGVQTAEVKLRTGEQIAVTASVRCTQDAVWVCAEVAVDGVVILTRQWRENLIRETDT